MKLKLSTLVIIIAIIFFGYYYFIDQPKEKPAAPPVSPAPPQPEPSEAQVALEGTTQLAIENFYVEPKSHTYPAQTYNPAGNVRPDNVMTFEDQVTYL